MAANGQPPGENIVNLEIADTTSQSSSPPVQREQDLKAPEVQGTFTNDTNEDSAPDCFARFRDLICQGLLACQDLERATALVAEEERNHDVIRRGLERKQRELARVRAEQSLEQPDRFLEVAEAGDKVKLYTKGEEKCHKLVTEARKTYAEAKERRSRLEEALYQLVGSLSEQSLAAFKLSGGFFCDFEIASRLRQQLKETRTAYEKARNEAAAMGCVIEGLAADFGITKAELAQVESVEAVAYFRQVGKSKYLQIVEEDLHVRLVKDERTLVESHGNICQNTIEALGLQAQNTDTSPNEPQKPDELISRKPPRSEMLKSHQEVPQPVRSFSSQAEIDEKNRLVNHRWQAKVRLDAEERKLEQLDQSYDDNLRRFKALQEPSATRSDFDRTCLRSKMKQLHKIRVAEEACHAARIAARDVGVEPSESDESIFGNVDDGYRLSEEARLATFDRDRVESWLAGVDERSEGSLPPTRPDDVELLNSADQDNLLAMNDSVSVIAVRKTRVKIDSWQEQNGTSKKPAEIESMQEQADTSKKRRLE